jgi:hypothetical protein
MTTTAIPNEHDTTPVAELLMACEGSPPLSLPRETEAS